MTPPPGYAPILTGKQGEFEALAALPSATRAVLRPVLDLAPQPPDRDPAAVIERLLRRVGKAFGNAGTVAVDLLALRGRQACGREPIEYLLDRADWCAAGVRLAARTDAPDDYLDLVAAEHRRARGVCVRAQVTADTGTAALADAVDAVLERLGLSRGAVHLCLDCGRVRDWQGRPDDVLAAHLERDLTAFSIVSMAATTVPPNDEIYRDEFPNRVPRREWVAWRRLHRAGRLVVFGDYGITGPRPTESVLGLPDPHLRYTTDSALLIWRGRRPERITEDDEGRPATFGDLCRALVAHDDFAGADFSDGDRAFADVAAGRRRTVAGGDTEGGPSQWVQWATSHHLAHVVDRLSSAAP